MLNNANMLNESKAAEIISHFQLFMRQAPGELGMNWSAFVVLATLASADAGYLSAAEIIERTGMNRGWAYRSIRVLSLKGLVDSVEQRGPRNQVRVLYTVNGKGSFYLTNALSPNGISMIKAFEGQN